MHALALQPKPVANAAPKQHRNFVLLRVKKFLRTTGDRWREVERPSWPRHRVPATVPPPLAIPLRSFHHYRQRHSPYNPN